MLDDGDDYGDDEGDGDDGDDDASPALTVSHRGMCAALVKLLCWCYDSTDDLVTRETQVLESRACFLCVS